MRLEPDQWQIGELCRGLAAAVVGIPTLISGVRGIVTGDTRRATDQLVAIAVLAAAATGDFVTATLIPLFLELGRLFEERSSLGARAAIDGIRALGARQAVRWRNGVEETRRSRTASRRETRSWFGPARESRWTAPCSKDGPRWTSPRSPASRFTRTWGPAARSSPEPSRWTDCSRFRCAGRARIPCSGGWSQLLAEVERATVPVLRLFERRAGVWLPLVLTIAATTLFFTEDLSRAIAVLVVATPTALVVAGPAAVVAAMTVATRLRILIKSADFLERASDVDTLILDKTGTVTVGAPGRHADPAGGQANPKRRCSPSRRRAALARCIRSRARSWPRLWRAESSARLPRIFRRGQVSAWSPWSMAGRPSSGAGRCWPSSASTLGCGRRRRRLAGVGRPRRALPRALRASRSAARRGPRSACRHASAGHRPAGAAHRRSGAVAREVGEALGMDEVVAEVLPAQKLEVVRAEQAAGRTVMMVGDGVNDAPALGGADVGVAIGAELNEVALGGADVALLGTDLGRLPRLIGLADITRRIIGQNVWLAFGLSVVLIALAARGILDPLTGALAQSVAVLVVVANSARILRFANPPRASG